MDNNLKIIINLFTQLLVDDVDLTLEDLKNLEKMIEIMYDDNLTDEEKRKFDDVAEIMNRSYSEKMKILIENTVLKKVLDYNIKTIKIPKYITSIDKFAFSDCTELISVEIPYGVTNIGVGAFWRCSELKSVKIPDSVNNIDPSAFKYCSNLLSIIIPKSVKVITFDVFKDCHSLSSVTLHDNITLIQNQAFMNCTSLKSIYIPKSVTIISDNAFNNCSSLESISIPKSVNIFPYAFSGCLDLIYVYIFDDENKQFHFKKTDDIIEYSNSEITDNIKSIVKIIFNVKEEGEKGKEGEGEEGRQEVVKFISNRMPVLFEYIEKKQTKFPPGIIKKIYNYK